MRFQGTSISKVAHEPSKHMIKKKKKKGGGGVTSYRLKETFGEQAQALVEHPLKVVQSPDSLVHYLCNPQLGKVGGRVD